MKLSGCSFVAFLLALAVTCSGQEYPAFEWLLDLEYGCCYSGSINSSSAIDNKWYFTKDNETVIFDRNDNTLEKWDFEVKRFYQREDGRYFFTADFPNGEAFVDQYGKVVRQTEYQNIEHIGEGVFLGKKEDSDFLYVITINKRRPLGKLKRLGETSRIECGDGLIYETNYDKNKSRITSVALLKFFLL